MIRQPSFISGGKKGKCSHLPVQFWSLLFLCPCISSLSLSLFSLSFTSLQGFVGLWCSKVVLWGRRFALPASAWPPVNLSCLGSREVLLVEQLASRVNPQDINIRYLIFNISPKFPEMQCAYHTFPVPYLMHGPARREGACEWVGECAMQLYLAHA